jgi:hypothetical protein
VDKKAKKILFSTYWGANGWLGQYKTDPADFIYAKEKGLMFDPISLSHDDCVNRIVEAVNAITIERVARGFLSSLSTKRLDWRSGIASWHVAKLMKPHPYTPVVSGHTYSNGVITSTFYTCGVCRDLKYGIVGHERYENYDLNVLNFERIKWGGVRHGDLIYTMFDIEQFARENIPEPVSDDLVIFNGILAAIENCMPGDWPSALRDRLKDVPLLKASKDERSIIMEILACVGVLNPATGDRPTKSKHDWKYVEFWRGEDGYDKNAVDKYFGKYL